MRRRYCLLLVLAVLLAAGCVEKTGEKKKDVIKIGEFGSLTGSTATFGQSTKKGIEMAVAEINAAGGVLGKPLQVLVEDDAGKPEEAAAVVTKLVNQSGVKVVLGEVASSRSLAGAPICQKAKVPMITPSSTNPKVTEVGDYIFRICFIDPFQGTVMAKFARENLKAKTAAVFRDIKNDYSVGLAQYFTETFTSMGGKVVSTEAYGEGDIDFKAQLTSIKTKSPDCVFVPGYYTEVGLIARQARELGITVPLLGGDGWDSPKLVEVGGKAIENCYFSNHYSVEDKSERVKSFVSKFKAKYGEVPDAMAALGYDAAKIMADAMERAKSEDGPAIRDALAKTQNYAGVTGVITIDENRNAKKSAVVLQISDGKQKYVTTLAP